MGHSRELADAARAWPFEEARKVVARVAARRRRGTLVKKSCRSRLRALRPSPITLRVPVPLGRGARPSPMSHPPIAFSTTWTASKFPETFPTRTCCAKSGNR